MDDEEFLQKLMQAFSCEAEEHLQAIIEGLLELEKTTTPARSQEIIEKIYREAHSLKGAGRSVDRTDVEAVCQSLESVFEVWKRKGAHVPARTFDVLNSALDFVEKLLKEPSAPVSAAARNSLQEMVRRVAGVVDDAAPVPAPSRPATPAVDEACDEEVAIEESFNAAARIAEPKSKSSGQESDRMNLVDTVRVPVAKMDALLLQIEEIVTVKIASRQRAAEFRELGSTLASLRKEWAKSRDTFSAVKGPLREFLDWNEKQIEELGKRLGGCAKAAERDERSASMLVGDLLNDAKRLVMLPFSRLLRLFPKLVRDLSHQEGKEVDLIITGSEIEIDKRILEEMKAPLLHLARNAVDHGLEQPAVRRRLGKPPKGTLAISVTQLDGSKVEIIVSDDGAGIDAGKVKASAVKSGVITDSVAASLSESVAHALIFQSGVSTSPMLTEISGRGLGMAIVREKVDKLGGQIAIETKAHAGASFRIILPLTLATFQAVLVVAGGQTFAVPPSGVVRITRVKRTEIKTVENLQTISLGGRALSLVWLSDVLLLPRRETREPLPFVEVLVLGSPEKSIGFVVETVVNEQEVLVKKLSKPLVRVRNISGATVLGSGAPVLILNVADLLKSARLASPGAGGPSPNAAPKRVSAVRHILVADDSVTSRMLLKNILESAGYHVITAVDGIDAIMALRSGDFDLVVSDVEMPRMDGFELTVKIRADKKFAELPVVLVTALGSQKNQERGVDAGANAYIVKSSFDQSNLLEVIARLV